MAYEVFVPTGPLIKAVIPGSSRSLVRRTGAVRLVVQLLSILRWGHGGKGLLAEIATADRSECKSQSQEKRHVRKKREEKC